MAKFYPTIINNFHGSEGERLVYEALSKLSHEYVIFHSYRWLGDVSQRRSEGEADFVILHPTKGILSIEVKAGGISYRHGNWIQTNRNTKEEKIIDPLGQAAESQFKIQNYLRRQYKGQLPIIGRAAWFPSVAISDKLRLPLEANKDIILDVDCLLHPNESLDKAFNYWKDNLGFKTNELSNHEFQSIINLLMPTFNIVESVASSVIESKQSYIRMTNQQASILQFLKEQRTAIIHGPAGTGKTMLAIEKAKMLAAEGQKVLYLCFNEFLLSYVSTHYKDENITFHNIRSLAEELITNANYTLSEIIPRFVEYFQHDYDDSLWEYVNVVIDEGQDIPEEILEHISMLVDMLGGHYYVFYDKNQYIMMHKSTHWLDTYGDCRLVLYKNCRNTAEIAKTVGTTVDSIKKDAYINELSGISPRGSFYKDEKELRHIVIKFITQMIEDKLKPEDIVVLTTSSVANSLLSSDLKVNGCTLSTEPKKNHILFTSVRKFKGLEARAVLLIDIIASRLTDELHKRLVYVGSSRANTYLQLAFYDNINEDEYSHIINHLDGKSSNTIGKKELLTIFGLEEI